MPQQPYDNFVHPNQIFCWFHGVVEDVDDPLQLGRIRVRCVGYHTDNLNDLSSTQLPWATIMMPVTSASMAGVGQSGTGIQQGSWVVGFFRDGPSGQDPIVMGSIPSISTAPNYAKGFSDPDKGNPSFSGPDIPKAATQKFAESNAYQSKITNSTTVSGGPTSQPTPQARINPQYPYNQVVRTASGHTIEYDDTPGYERISLLHKSGSFIEIDGAGNMHMFTKGNFFHKVTGNYVVQATRIDLNP